MWKKAIQNETDNIRPTLQPPATPTTQQQVISPNTQKKIIEESVMKHLATEKDKGSRKENMIVFHMKEPKSKLKAENDIQDKREFLHICNKTLGVTSRMKISQVRSV